MMNTKNVLKKNLFSGFIAPLLLLVFLFGTLFSSCGGPSGPFELIDALQEMMEDRISGDKGKVIAKVENQELYKRLFEMQVDLALKYSGLDEKRQLQEKYDLENQKKMLESAVFNMAILEEMRNDKEIINDPEFVVFLNMTLMQGLQQYYLIKKLGDKIQTEVTDKEIGQLYDRLIQNPRYKEQLSRMPKRNVDRLLKQRVLEMRKQQAIQRVLMDLQGKYRISKFENRLGAGSEDSGSEDKQKTETQAPDTDTEEQNN